MKPRRKGQSLLEFALLLPILVLVFLGVFDCARALWYSNTLSQAAREGTRYATVHGSTSPNPLGPGDHYALTQSIRRLIVGMDSSQVVVNPTWQDGSISAGSLVTVEVSYRYVPLTTMIVGGVPLELRSVSTGNIVY